MVDLGEEVDSNLTFELSIIITNDEAPMKNIIVSTLPNFHGLASEVPDTFRIKFYVLWRRSNYIADAQKFNLFPSTLKNATL